MGVLQKKVVSGFIWTAGEKFGSTAIKLLVALFLMSMIAPSDHGLIGLLTVFFVIGNILTDSGFGLALIQRKHVTDTDYNSVFYLNIALAVVIYAILVAFSGLIANYYHQPMLTRLAPWYFAAIPISSLGLVQMTKFNREMSFGPLAKLHITSTIFSSVVAVGMVYAGMGIWSIVGQVLSLQVARVSLSWIMSSWRPGLAFSMTSIRNLFSFGSNMLFTGLISQAFGNLSQLVIGKLDGTTQLGFYDKALKLKEEISSAIQLSIITVTFPAFSELQSEDEKLKFASRKVIAVISLILFPAMAGLMLVSGEIFSIVLPKWMASVPYFQTFCIAAFFMPLAYICQNIIKAKGASRTILYLEIIKKSFTLVVIAYTARIGIMAMVTGYVAWMAFEMIVNAVASQRFIKYSISEIARDTLPYLGLTAIMAAAVYSVGFIPGLTLGITLFLKIVVGIGSYIVLNAIMRPQAWRDAILIAGTILKRSKQDQNRSETPGCN